MSECLSVRWCSCPWQDPKDTSTGACYFAGNCQTVRTVAADSVLLEGHVFSLVDACVVSKDNIKMDFTGQ